jgi:hypothetical protein
MRHFKEHMNHKYLGLDKKDINLKGYTGKIKEEVKNIHFQEHLKLIKK